MVDDHPIDGAFQVEAPTRRWWRVAPAVGVGCPAAVRAREKNERQVLGEAIGDLLPSAFAVALSPIPIVAVVLVLGAPHARTAGPAFALGWIAGLLAASVIVVLVLGTGADSDSDDPGVDWLKVTIGILFLLMAAQQWKKRPKHGREPEAPKWMATVDTATPQRAAVLGAALSGANPKNLALTLAASASIAEAGLDQADTAVAIAVFVTLGSVTVAGSVLFYLLDADRAARPLAAVKQFMSDNNAVIMMVVLLLLGAKLLGDGLAGLWR
jgi:threonine/homoserine/homoserine lactone efflux protein